MIRTLGALVLGAIGLVVLIVLAPILLLVALLVLLLAWLRPTAVERVSGHPRAAPIPAGLRSTPVRFAATLVVLAAALTGVSVAIAGAPDEGAAADATSRAAPTATVQPTPSATARPTATPPEPTASPTSRPTPRPTPTPEPTPGFGREPTGPTEIGVVTNVVDGDTIDVLVDGAELRVRYIGMDTPEVHNGTEWLGPEAAAANAALVEGSQVKLERDVSETDQYGRALRYVWVEDGRGWLLVNLELIRLGLASITTYPPDVKYVDELYVPAQDEAQAAGRGMWGAAPTPVPTPAPTPVPPAPPPAPPANCEPSYPDICVPIGAPDLDCGDMYAQGIEMIRVRYDVPNPDPHRFDGNDNDGWGCEGS